MWLTFLCSDTFSCVITFAVDSWLAAGIQMNCLNVYMHAHIASSAFMCCQEIWSDGWDCFHSCACIVSSAEYGKMFSFLCLYCFQCWNCWRWQRGSGPCWTLWFKPCLKLEISAFSSFSSSSSLLHSGLSSLDVWVKCSRFTHYWFSLCAQMRNIFSLE